MTEEEIGIIASTPITMGCFEMGDFEIVDMGFTNNCNGITKGNNEDLWIVLCSLLEMLRKSYNETKDKRYLYELIRLLPNSYKVVKL